MIVITGATGQLGRLVITELLKSLAADQIVAAVRTPHKAKDLASLGVQVREADYDRPDTLIPAFAGASRVLLISSSEVGRRVSQHQAAVDAAKGAGVELLAYTSVLRAGTSPLALAAEHRETEAAIQASGVPYVFLRNGWYNENHAAAIPAAIEHGALLGAAGDGRIASASRADYAEAAAKTLLTPRPERVYELAGDTSYTLGELAASISEKSGKTVVYNNLTEADYRSALLDAGVPAGMASVLADSDSGAANGALFEEGRQLSALIGRATTPMTQTVASQIAASNNR